MSVTSLTGSELARFENIHDNWLVFEPVTHENAIQYGLYTVPIGQTQEPELFIDSGSVLTQADGISIVKSIYRFFNETDAANFISDIGIDNIVSYCEITKENELGEDEHEIQIQVVNSPIVTFDLSFLDFEIRQGFVVEVFQSGTVEQGGTRKVLEEIVVDRNGRIINDTHSKFFIIETDKEDAR